MATVFTNFTNFHLPCCRIAKKTHTSGINSMGGYQGGNVYACVHVSMLVDILGCTLNQFCRIQHVH